MRGRCAKTASSTARCRTRGSTGSSGASGGRRRHRGEGECISLLTPGQPSAKPAGFRQLRQRTPRDPRQRQTRTARPKLGHPLQLRVGQPARHLSPDRNGETNRQRGTDSSSKLMTTNSAIKKTETPATTAIPASQPPVTGGNFGLYLDPPGRLTSPLANGASGGSMRCSSLPSSVHLTTSTTFPLAACRPAAIPHCGRLVGELPRPASANVDDTEAVCHVERVKEARHGPAVARGAGNASTVARGALRPKRHCAARHA